MFTHQQAIATFGVFHPPVSAVVHRSMFFPLIFPPISLVRYVMPFHQSGAWICCNLELVGTEEEPAHYCGYTWHEEAPPLLCLRWRCKGGVRQLEYHFGELGFACRACGRFESLQSLKLPLSAPPRLQNLPSPPPTPKKKKQKERGKLSYESSYTERA